MLSADALKTRQFGGARIGPCRVQSRGRGFRFDDVNHNDLDISRRYNVDIDVDVDIEPFDHRGPFGDIADQRPPRR